MWFLTFQRIVVHSSSSIKHFFLDYSTVEGEGTMILENKGNHSFDNTVLHPRRPESSAALL
jgi:hypothetical protein